MATPLTATPIPAYTALPDVPADLTAALNNLEKFAIPRFATVTARDAAITSPVEGQQAYVTATHTLYQYLGGWINIVGMIACTSSTRPSTPWAGCEIFETDTLNMYVWDGSAWRLTGSADRGVYALAAGNVSIAVLAADTSKTVSISFPAGRFSVAPLLTATVNSGSGSAFGISVMVNTTTTTTANVAISPRGAAGATFGAAFSPTVNWTAVQMTPTSAAG